MPRVSLRDYEDIWVFRAAAVSLILFIRHVLDTADGQVEKFLILLARPTGIEPVFPP